MTEEKRERGRPFKYTCPKELQKAVDEYFDSLMDADKKFFLRPPTVSGLAYHLDITTRTLLNYSKEEGERAGLFPIVSRAKQRCEYFLEEAAIIGKTKNPISLLSMNFGRHEKSQLDVTHKGDLADKIMAARKRAGIATVLTEDEDD